MAPTPHKRDEENPHHQQAMGVTSAGSGLSYLADHPTRPSPLFT